MPQPVPPNLGRRRPKRSAPPDRPPARRRSEAHAARSVLLLRDLYARPASARRSQRGCADAIGLFVGRRVPVRPATDYVAGWHVRRIAYLATHRRYPPPGWDGPLVGRRTRWLLFLTTRYGPFRSSEMAHLQAGSPRWGRNSGGLEQPCPRRCSRVRRSGTSCCRSRLCGPGQGPCPGALCTGGRWVSPGSDQRGAEWSSRECSPPRCARQSTCGGTRAYLSCRARAAPAS